MAMEGDMDRTATESVIKVILTEISQRLDKASWIAKAAEACASAGDADSRPAPPLRSSITGWP